MLQLISATRMFSHLNSFFHNTPLRIIIFIGLRVIKIKQKIIIDLETGLIFFKEDHSGICGHISLIDQ